METLIYLAIVFAISCVGFLIVCMVCPPHCYGFGDWVFMVAIVGAIVTGLSVSSTGIASMIQDAFSSQPIDPDVERTATEFVIHAGIVFAGFFTFFFIGMIGDSGSVDLPEFGKTLLTCIVVTIVSIAITSAAHAIQDSFEEQPEPPPIERINFD